MRDFFKDSLGPSPHSSYNTHTHTQSKTFRFDWCPAAQLDVIDHLRWLYPSPRLSGAQFAVTLSASALFLMRLCVCLTVTFCPFVTHLVRLTDALWIRFWSGLGFGLMFIHGDAVNTHINIVRSETKRFKAVYMVHDVQSCCVALELSS